MTQQEFEERTGEKVTPEQYREIEQAYLNAWDMDKDEFCRDWLTMDGRENIMAALSKCANELRGRADALACKKAELVEMQDEIADFLLDNPGVDAMRAKAIRMLGSEREYIRRKCERGLRLDADDKAIILRLL